MSMPMVQLWLWRCGLDDALDGVLGDGLDGGLGDNLYFCNSGKDHLPAVRRNGFFESDTSACNHHPDLSQGSVYHCSRDAQVYPETMPRFTESL